MGMVGWWAFSALDDRWLVWLLDVLCARASNFAVDM